MRRRSVSALSTAAVRLVSSLVTWAAWTCSAFGPSSARASASSRWPTPTVIHGATTITPTTPTAAAIVAPPPAVSSKK